MPFADERVDVSGESIQNDGRVVNAWAALDRLADYVHADALRDNL